MCGIAGVFRARRSGEELRTALEAMNAAQIHRGPDEEGHMVAPELGAGLASRRLSIVGIAHGRQPMANEEATIHAVLNGEIYNHGDLREELTGRGHRFRGSCDTEVIAHAYEEWGDEFLSHLHGMFGLAVLDGRAGRLLLARDGPGMKPLYYRESGGELLFASEVRAIFATGWATPAPNLRALDANLAVGYTPSPMTMFQGIEKLCPGEYLVAEAGTIRKRFFWRLRYEADRPGKTDADYVEEFESLFDAAVRSHLAADVPVGAFLSGGWDSSLTTTLAARHASSRLKTFSIVFPDSPTMDESRYSRLMAKRLGTEHYEIEYTESTFIDVMSRHIRHLEEPISAAPSGVFYVLASLGAHHVKTVISGEGADELFGGYHWMRINWPYRLRGFLPKPPLRWLARRTPVPRYRRALRILGAPTAAAADVEWRHSLTAEDKAALLKPEFRAGGPDVEPVILDEDILATCGDGVQRRLACDFTGRLADGILFDADKMTMAHSLELRMPFLDRSIVEFALRLPSRLKIRGGREKVILGKLARKLLPPQVATRRKHGLGYPGRPTGRGPASRFVREVLLDADRHGPFRKEELERRIRQWRKYPGGGGLILQLLLVQCWWNEFFGP